MHLRHRWPVSGLAIITLLSALLAAIGVSRADAVVDNSGGVFAAVTPFRLVDTATGVGGSSTAFGAGTVRSYTVLGQGGIPTTDVAAVVLDISAKSSTVAGGSAIRAWASGTTPPSAMALYFSSANVPRSNMSVVPVGSDGKISLGNINGTTNLDVDVQGYFTKTSTEGSAGGVSFFEQPERVLSTADGTGMPQGMTGPSIAAGTIVEFQVTDPLGVGIRPEANGVFASIEVRNSTVASGTVKVAPGGTPLGNVPASMNYTNAGPQVSTVSVPVSSDGVLRLINSASSGSIEVKVDITAITYSDPRHGASFVALPAATVYSSEASGNTALAGGETRLVDVAGVAGIPTGDKVSGVVLNLTAANWATNGTLTVYNPDYSPPSTTSLTFWYNRALPKVSTLAITAISDNGQVVVRNTSSAPVHFYLTVQGYATWDRGVDMGGPVV